MVPWSVSSAVVAPGRGHRQHSPADLAIQRHGLAISPEQAGEEGERAKVLQTVLGDKRSFSYVEESIVVKRDGQTQAFLLPGKFPGFKTYIKVILALGPDFTLRGLEVVEH